MLSDVDKIINASGYDKEVLLEEYKWLKEKELVTTEEIIARFPIYKGG